MNPSERARSSQTDVVTGAPDSCPSGIDLASSPYVDPPVNPGLHIGAPVPCQPPSVPSGEAYENSMLDFGESIFAPMLVDDSMDLTSLFQQDLSEKADGNTSVDAFCREDDPSHLPESSRDPPEQAGGNTVLSVGDGGSFERGGGSNSPWIEEGIYYHQAGGSQHRSQSERSSRDEHFLDHYHGPQTWAMLNPRSQGPYTASAAVPGVAYWAGMSGVAAVPGVAYWARMSGVAAVTGVAAVPGVAYRPRMSGVGAVTGVAAVPGVAAAPSVAY